MEINKETIIKNINSILAAVSMVVWFLPMFGLNAKEAGYVNSLSASGFEAFTGLTFSDGTILPMNISSVFLVVFPLLLILSNYVKQLEKWKRYYIFASPAFSIVFLVITKFSVQSRMNVTVSTNVGFWLYFILNVALLVLAYFQYKSIELDKAQIQKFMEESSAKFVSASQNFLGITCPNCGAKIVRGKKFCPKCGKKLPETQNDVKTKKCVSCGEIVPETSKFCPKCGAELPEEEKNVKTMRCTNCGATISKTSKFCPECGQSVPEEKTEPKKTIVKCQSCGHEMSAEQKFCSECGTPVENVTFKCPKCGVEVKEGVKFCPECGSKVTGE